MTGVKELLFSVQDGEFVFGKTEVLAELSLEELVIGGDGFLELYLGGPDGRPIGCRWPLKPSTSTSGNSWVTGRTTRSASLTSNASTTSDRSATSPRRRTPLPSVAWRRGSKRASTCGRPTWPGLRSFLPVNELQAPHKPVGGADNMLHGAGQWELEPDAALVVEFDQPEVTYWSIQTYVLDWMVPLDFANRVTSLNDRQLHVDDDGLVRVVLVTHRPGSAELARHLRTAAGSLHIPLRAANDCTGATDNTRESSGTPRPSPALDTCLLGGHAP